MENKRIIIKSSCSGRGCRVRIILPKDKKIQEVKLAE